MSYFVFRATGFAEVEFTSVITLHAYPEVTGGWRDNEASDSGAVISLKSREFVLQGVDPRWPVSRRVLIVGPDVGQMSGFSGVPHFYLETSATWTHMWHVVRWGHLPTVNRFKSQLMDESGK